MSTGTEFQGQEDPKVLRKMIFASKENLSVKPSSSRYVKENLDPGPAFNPASKPHRRSGSHHRQKSIYFPPESTLEAVIQSLKPLEAHNRNLSDADSVVYLGPADKDTTNETSQKKIELRLSAVETATGSLLSIEKQVSPRKKVPCLGNVGTTSFCRFCKKDVHTKVELNSCYSNRLMTAFSSIVGCCSYPNWMAEYIVHKCPSCLLVLGKSR